MNEEVRCPIETFLQLERLAIKLCADKGCKNPLTDQKLHNELIRAGAILSKVVDGMCEFGRKHGA